MAVLAREQQTDAGLFGPDSVTWRVNGDQSMAIAGFRALLLQAVHPLVMAGFNDNTVWFDDMWGRLQRTGDWVGTVTYGTTARPRRPVGPCDASTRRCRRASSPSPAFPTVSTTPSCCAGST